MIRRCSATRINVSQSRPCGSQSPLRGKQYPYPFIEVVAAELHSRIGDDADAVGTITAHEAPPALLHPHLLESLADREFVGIAADALDLHQDLEPERTFLPPNPLP